MKLIILLSLFLLGQPKLEKIYSKEEILSSYDHVAIRQWELKLLDQGVFMLNYKMKDSRKEKLYKASIIGTWTIQKDSILLKGSSQGDQECYFKSARYIITNSELKSSDIDLCFPKSLYIGNRFTIKI